MSQRLLPRALVVQLGAGAGAGLLWSFIAPTVRAGRAKGGEVLPMSSAEVGHQFVAFAVFVGVGLVAGAAGALVAWLSAARGRGAGLAGVVLLGSAAGGLFAAAVGELTRSLLHPGPGAQPGSIAEAAVQLSGQEVVAVSVAFCLGAAVVLFLAVAATTQLTAWGPQDRELVGDS